jgi:hypothetical protein
MNHSVRIKATSIFYRLIPVYGKSPFASPDNCDHEFEHIDGPGNSTVVCAICRNHFTRIEGDQRERRPRKRDVLPLEQRQP